eukprot:gnl/Hemi2/17955_TR5926_c0_g1_i1.p1 gnl/Hemi2/17955_TR5926_c0_g1~~gnl/Hemi2/17955_TR5926_c0_g1_i1.p1  ORF type:complete len:440 (+),score=60.39 gnl/Hemi2/17955_TR5926_c0_g1_i1:240-1559(+)
MQTNNNLPLLTKPPPLIDFVSNAPASGGRFTRNDSYSARAETGFEKLDRSRDRSEYARSEAGFSTTSYNPGGYGNINSERGGRPLSPAFSERSMSISQRDTRRIPTMTERDSTIQRLLDQTKDGCIRKVLFFLIFLTVVVLLEINFQQTPITVIGCSLCDNADSSTNCTSNFSLFSCLNATNSPVCTSVPFTDSLEYRPLLDNPNWDKWNTTEFFALAAYWICLALGLASMLVLYMRIEARAHMARIFLSYRLILQVPQKEFLSYMGLVWGFLGAFAILKWVIIAGMALNSFSVPCGGTETLSVHLDTRVFNPFVRMVGFVAVLVSLAPFAFPLSDLWCRSREMHRNVSLQRLINNGVKDPACSRGLETLAAVYSDTGNPCCCDVREVDRLIIQHYIEASKDNTWRTRTLQMDDPSVQQVMDVIYPNLTLTPLGPNSRV